MYYKQAVFFPISFMISELSVIPMNWVWFLQTFRKLGISTNPQTLKIALWSRALLFVTARTPIGPLALWYATRQHQSSLSDFWRVTGANVPPIVKYATSFNVLVFTMLNLYWTLKSIQRINR